MINVAKLVNQDVDIAFKLVEGNKLDVLNVMGNRILQNLFALNNRELMILGLAIKEITSNLGAVHGILDETDEGIIDCHEIAKVAIQNMKITSNCVEPVKIWNQYINFENNVRTYLINQEERDVYKDDTEFSKEATIFYLTLLKDEMSFLLERNIQPLERTRSELATLFNTHGGTQAIIAYTCIKALEHTYGFALHGKISDEELEHLISSNIDKIDGIKSSIQKGDENELLIHANAMVGDVMHDYRKYFFLFGERVQPVSMPQVPELQMPVPQVPVTEAVEKIRDIVEKGKDN